MAANSYVAVPVETDAGNGVVDAFSTAATTNATNCYYDSTVEAAATSSKAAARSTIVLQTPAMALALNNARADGPWTQTAVVNQGYPSFGTLTGVTWATVGQAQDEAALRNQDVTVDGNTVKALSGKGDQDSPYILNTPRRWPGGPAR
ncbi:MAG: hypothetical protein ACLSVD_14090 [Eggerthellaceae bacterium]